ncbi:hypothetical protein M3Y99_01679700 [Aphelenchoides fujianensis]|nr:hypothetical protein M3Y99_01679700 [Aphelenchoides fujianensis]
MNVQQWGTPAPPNRSTSQKTEGTWREGLGTVLAIFLGLAVLFSVFVILFFVYRDSARYEELTDFLDKTASVSKINYQPHLGYFEIRKEEVSQLGDQRNYKSLLYFFLFADAATLFFVTTCILPLLHVGRPRREAAHHVLVVPDRRRIVLTWGVLRVHLLPHAVQRPTAKLDRKPCWIERSPTIRAACLQMEHRLGCTFNQNLYNTFQRKNNPRNTCDPLVVESFISVGMMISFIVLRLVPTVLFIVLMIVRPHRAKYIKKANAKKSGPFGFERTPQKSTTFDANEKRTPPVISSPIDHTLSYNNAAYFAVSGANLHGGSSRSSEIDAADLFHRNNGSIHTQNSLVSEV